MKPAEFASLRARIPDSDDDLSVELGVPVAKLERWRTGAERIPRLEARLIGLVIGHSWFGPDDSPSSASVRTS